MTTTDIPRPDDGDVVELIIADHRLFEELLRALRDRTEDRTAVRAALADVVVAHAEAEERHVYPALTERTSVDDDEVEHGRHEHLEGNEALLDLLAVDDVDGESFDDAVEELTKALAHHLDEEEREILNPARTETSDDTRAELGRIFAKERARQLDGGCGEIDNVRRVVEKARADGVA